MISHVSEEVRILGKFVPSLFQAEILQTEIIPYLPPCCQRERITVRTPHERAPDPPQANLEWHHDGGGVEGTTRHMVVWASEQPTELKTSNGERPHTEPFDVVWFDNDKAFHRQPTGTDEKKRWFVSVRCSGA